MSCLAAMSLPQLREAAAERARRPFMVTTQGTGKISDERPAQRVLENLDLRAKGINKLLALKAAA